MLPPCSLMEKRPASSKTWLSSCKATNSTWVGQHYYILLPFSAVQAQVTICPAKKVLTSARESQSLWNQALRCCCDLSQLTQPVACLARSWNVHAKTLRSQSRTMYLSCKELYTCVEGCWRESTMRVLAGVNIYLSTIQHQFFLTRPGHQNAPLTSLQSGKFWSWREGVFFGSIFRPGWNLGSRAQKLSEAKPEPLQILWLVLPSRGDSA